ncbi:reverse transcriptase domain-containing protein [Artemisia annua]|uniref:Reverse transcriptase domain-containing protein n=1 Tax=Artemisia annua TaxID=35608 RepID=A0A2U1KSH2_ARTAN|nr:reverse transcriptase domain-containing protein [Artemisia annua]
MYTAFTHARKDIPHRSLATNGNPTVEPWNSDSEEAHLSKALGKTFVESDGADPTTAIPLGSNDTKGKATQNVEFYHQPFVFKEPNRDTKYLIASPFTSRIRDYDMPDRLKVPTNLKTYDGMSDPDDHLTIFMGTLDVHKLPEPVWCRFFPITLCGSARFSYENLAPGSIDGFHQLRDKFRANFLQQRRFQKTQAKILGIRQRPDESLKDNVARFNKETLNMADRSDAMVSGAFISGLRPGRLFKDLIERPPTSLEDLFTQTHNFIRAEDANNENRLREPRQGNRDTKQHVTYKDLPRKHKDKFVSCSATRYNEHRKAPHDGFTALIKSREEIFATVEGKSMLRPPPKMFTPGNKRDKTKYCEFHEDHSHDTNDCIDLRKEIEMCVRKGRLSHLAKGAKT